MGSGTTASSTASLATTSAVRRLGPLGLLGPLQSRQHDLGRNRLPDHADGRSFKDSLIEHVIDIGRIQNTILLRAFDL